MPSASVALEALVPLRDRLLGVDQVRPGVVVACSGGADSLALLALMRACALRPVAVHVDHGLRPGSERDGEIVVEHAKRLRVDARLETARIDPGPNLEARAHEARYAALERARAALGAGAILVGHTADDQAETVLLNLLRGSASAGLGAMPVWRGRVGRPMLEIRRAETEAVCAQLGFEPVRDPTNDDHAYRRNWIRQVVLPLLSEGSARDLVPVLTRQAALMRDDSKYLDGLAHAAWLADGPRPASALASMPLALSRRAVRLWLGPPPPSLDEVERVLAVARGDARATEVAGGRRVWRTAGRLHTDPRR